MKGLEDIHRFLEIQNNSAKLKFINNSNNNLLFKNKIKTILSSNYVYEVVSSSFVKKEIYRSFSNNTLKHYVCLPHTQDDNQKFLRTTLAETMIYGITNINHVIHSIFEIGKIFELQEFNKICENEKIGCLFHISSIKTLIMFNKIVENLLKSHSIKNIESSSDSLFKYKNNLFYKEQKIGYIGIINLHILKKIIKNFNKTLLYIELDLNLIKNFQIIF